MADGEDHDVFAGDGWGGERQQPQPNEQPKPAGGKQEAESERLLRQVDEFPAWENILSTVQKALVQGGERQEFDSPDFADHFSKTVSDLIDKHAEWNVQPLQTHRLTDLLRSALFGYGPLEPLMNIDGLEEIMINRFDTVWIIVRGKKRRVQPSPFDNEKQLRNFVDRVMNAQGKELNLSNPADDGVLADGSRIQVTIPPVALDGVAATIRKFKPQPFTMREYLETGMFSPEFLIDLRRMIDANYTIVISGGTSSGKAQPLDSKVLTPYGWRKMGDLQPGDSIIGSDGRKQHVIGVFPQGNKQVFRVHLRDGSIIECCDEHLWAVQSRKHRHRSQPGVVLTTKQLREDLYHKDGSSKWYLPTMTAPVQYEPDDEPLPLPSYTLGALLGDGTISGSNTSPILTSVDQQVLDMVSEELPAGLGLTPVMNGGAATISYRITDGIRKAPNVVIDALRELGLWGHQAHEKRIPDRYMRASVEDRLALLQGLCDTDGELSGSGVEFSSCSPHLAAQVRDLVRSLGGTSRVRARRTWYTYKGQRRQGRRSYRVRITMPQGMSPFQLERKRELYDQRCGGRVIARSITKIEEAGIKPMQCIAVSAADQLYVTNGFALTHNTTFINAVGALIDDLERLIIMEDTPELQVRTQDTLRLKTIGGGARGQKQSDQTITMRDLVRYALRQRPDRILIGEVRGNEAFDLLQALNTGHAGSFTTIHADAAILALSRLRDLAVGANIISEKAAENLVASAVDIVVQVGRIKNQAGRRVIEVRQVFHRSQLSEAAKRQLKPIIEAGDVERTGEGTSGTIYSFPLYVRNDDDKLVKVWDILPMAGRDLPPASDYADDPFNDGSGPFVTDAEQVDPPEGAS